MHAGEIDDVTPDKLQQWVGRSRQTDDFAAPWPVAALGATLDEDDPDPKMGDAVPPLWHWLYFLEIARQSGIGPDGHAERRHRPGRREIVRLPRAAHPLL